IDRLALIVARADYRLNLLPERVGMLLAGVAFIGPAFLVIPLGSLGGILSWMAWIVCVDLLRRRGAEIIAEHAGLPVWDCPACLRLWNHDPRIGHTPPFRCDQHP